MQQSAMMENVDRLSAMLLEARKNNQPVSSLPAECMPQDVEQAYAVQESVTRKLGAIGGWKVGAKGPDAPPVCAMLPASLIHAVPYTLPMPPSGMLGIEAEIAVKLTKDLPPRQIPYTRSEVVAAAGSIHPAIEVVSSRHAGYPKIDPLFGLADSLANGFLVYGTGRTSDLEIDQRQQLATLYFDGAEVARAEGGNPAGDIWQLIAWLANHAAMRTGGLRAGEIITTGSCTGLLHITAPTSVSAIFPGLGTVALRIE